MQTSTEQSSQVELRKPPKGSTSYHYIVYRLNSTLHVRSYVSADELQKRYLDRSDVDIVLHYYQYSVEVDGIVYRYNPNSIHRPNFYTLEQDYTHSPDEEVGWSEPFRYSPTCDRCDTEWQMDDEAFLCDGSILCAQCGSRGALVGL